MIDKQKAIAALENNNYNGLPAAVVAECVKVIRALPEEDGWISVKDRMPEEFTSVIVHVPGENQWSTVREAYFARGGWCTRIGIFSTDDVTHWMPLPEPPKEGK